MLLGGAGLAAARPPTIAGATHRASDDRSFTFALVAGELWSGLQAVARISGRRVLVPDGAATLAGHRHAPLHGQLRVEEAMQRLLAGSGWDWEHDAQGSLVVRKVRTRAATLAPLRIDGERLVAPTPAALSHRDRDRGDASATSTLDTARLAALGPASIDAVLRRAPNVSGVGSALAIRGVERGSGTGATSQVLLDDVPLATPLLADLALPALEAAQFRRGPRTIADGAPAIAGVIALRSAEPQPDPGGHVRVAASMGGGATLRAGRHGGGGLDGASHALGIVARRDAGTRSSVRTGERDLDAGSQALLHGKWRYEPDAWPALTLQVSALALQARPGTRAVLPPDGGGVFDPHAGVSHDPLNFDARRDARGVAFAVDYAPDGPQRFGAQLRTSDARGTTTRSRPTGSDERLRRDEREVGWELALRFERDLAAGWSLRLGADRSRRDARLAEALFTPLREFFPPAVEVDVTPGIERRLVVATRQHATTDGALAQLAWRGAAFTARAGLRRTGERRAATRSLEVALGDGACRLRVAGIERDCAVEFPSSASRARTPSSDARSVPELHLGWQPSSAQRVSLDLRRGFVGGGARLDTGAGRLAPYAPERSDVVDLGWRARLADGRLDVSLDVFHHRWRDRHVPVDLPQRDSYVIVNAGRAHASGGELQLHWRPHDALQAWVGIGVLHTRFDRFDALLPSGPVDLAGRRFPGAPARTASAGLRWSPTGGWEVGAEAWHAASAWSDAENSAAGRRPAHTVLDFALRRAFGAQLTLELAVRNAGDARWLEDVRVAGVQPRAREYLPGMQREIELGLEWRW